MRRLYCAECGIALSVVDADDAVKTDAGPVHRECFEGPVPPGSEADLDWLEEENERRREMGDAVIVPDPYVTGPSDQFGVSTEGVEVVTDWKSASDLPQDVDPDRQRRAYERALSPGGALKEAASSPLDLSGPSILVHPRNRKMAEKAMRVDPRANDCPECHAEPSIDGGRGFECRGRSML